MIINTLAHVTPAEFPSGVLLFAAGVLLGALLVQVFGYIRNR